MKKILKYIFIFIMILINKIFPNKISYCNKKTKRCGENLKNKNFKYYLWGKNTPDCCLNNLKKILTDLSEVLDNYNKKYFIIWGTLLGAVRHKGFIPWDTDIDIGILRNDFEEISKILTDNLENKYYIDFSKVKKENVIRVCLSKTNNLHIDIEIWDEDINTLSYKDEKNEYVYKKDYFFPMKNYKFENLYLPGPNKEELILEEYYGKNFKNIGYKKYALFNKREIL